MINNLSIILEGLNQVTKDVNDSLASIKSEITSGGKQLVLYVDYVTKEYMITQDKYTYIYLDSHCINIGITKTMKEVKQYAQQLKNDGYKQIPDKWGN
ncbi:Hypothetical protein ATHO_27 [Enterococcus phage Athos]|nr:Hypothetical protein ATHO_27 [Enterococcus phage Athos]